MRKLLFAICFMLTPTFSVAGPFGFSNNDAPSATYCSKMDQPQWYKCMSAPKPHSDFEYYIIQHQSNLGVCFLKAVGKNIDTNSFGSQLTAQVNKIKNQISSKYGSPTKVVDHLMNGSIWNEPEDFMMSMVQKDRIFYIEWDVDPSSHAFESLAITRSALSTDEGYVNVEYYYPNSDKCDEASTKNEASSF